MSGVALLWTMAAALSTGAILAMIYLLVSRSFRARYEIARQRSRERLSALMLAAMSGRHPSSSAFSASAGLLAECLLQIAGAVTGPARRRVTDAVHARGGLGILETGAISLRRGSRLACIDAIAMFPAEQAALPLRRLLLDEDFEIRISAVGGLAGLPAPVSISRLLDVVLTRGQVPSARVADVLMRLARRDACALAAALDRADLDDPMRAAMLTAIGQAGDLASVSLLCRFAAVDRPVLRAAAIDALGALKHPEGERFVSDGLADTDWTVRAASIRAARHAPFPALAAAVQRLRGDPFWLVRFEAGGQAAP